MEVVASMYANDNLLRRRQKELHRAQRDTSRHINPSNAPVPPRAGSRPLVGERAWRARFTTPALLALLSAVFLFCVWLRMMTYELRRDEQIYVPPTRLLDEHALYADFFYNHPPGSAWLFHAVRLLTGSDYVLLDARLGVLAAWMLLTASVGLVCFAVCRSALVSWCVTVLFLANEFFLSQVGMTATNNFLPLPLSFLGLALFIIGVRDGRARSLLIAISGFCLSGAAVLKLNAFAVIPPVAVAALLLPPAVPLRRRLTHVVAPLLLGGVIGALPILYYLATDGARFLAHVVSYHIGPHAELARLAASAGEPMTTTLGGKSQLALDVWFSRTTAIEWVAVLAFLLIGRAWTMASAPRPGAIAGMVVVFAAFGFAAALSFLPTPSFPQYYALPLICLPLAMVLAYDGLPNGARPYAQSVMIAGAALSLLMIAPRLVQHGADIFRPHQWTVARVHASGVALAERLAEAGAPGKVATLAPIYVLEGGSDVYLELATGLFAYRTGDITPPELARHYRTTSPSRVRAMLETEPPAALLLGFEPKLEEPLLAYATENGYRPLNGFEISDRYGTGLLYVRQPPLDAARPH